jgi:hypothetical protein
MFVLYCWVLSGCCCCVRSGVIGFDSLGAIVLKILHGLLARSPAWECGCDGSGGEEGGGAIVAVEDKSGVGVRRVGLWLYNIAAGGKIGGDLFLPGQRKADAFTFKNRNVAQGNFVILSLFEHG